MEAYNSLPAHLLHHLQPQFLHPSLSLGSGAFRPIADLKAFPSPSAFGPPKCLKIETSGNSGLLVNSHGHNIFNSNEDRFLGSQNSRTDSCSPASVSLSPPPPLNHPPPPSAIGQVKEESMDAHMSEEGDGNQTPGPSSCDAQEQSHAHEENRGFRRKLIVLLHSFLFAKYSKSISINSISQLKNILINQLFFLNLKRHDIYSLCVYRRCI